MWASYLRSLRFSRLLVCSFYESLEHKESTLADISQLMRRVGNISHRDNLCRRNFFLRSEVMPLVALPWFFASLSGTLSFKGANSVGKGCLASLLGPRMSSPFGLPVALSACFSGVLSLLRKTKPPTEVIASTFASFCKTEASEGCTFRWIFAGKCLLLSCLHSWNFTLLQVQQVINLPISLQLDQVLCFCVGFWGVI